MDGKAVQKRAAGDMEGVRPADVGIVAIDMYNPFTYVSQASLEAFCGVSAGKYTIGLGQDQMRVASDREDTVSMALTVMKRVMNRNNIDHMSIGRLEVATESPIDKSKSVKSCLMNELAQHGNTDVEGVDNINACYAGTACLFNSCAWVESSGWDGRLAMVICSDLAVYEKGPARPAGGAGTVCFVIGPNAPLVVEPGLRASHFEHVYDFYKPNPNSEFPTVDGKLSNDCYTRALDNCWKRLRAKFEKVAGGDMRASSFSHMCFHSPYNKLVRKSYAKLIYNDYAAHPNDPAYAGVDEKFVGLTDDEVGEQYEKLVKHFIKLSDATYQAQVSASATVGKRVGNMYTASVYGALVGLMGSEDPDALLGKRVLMFSYGSGLASSMFVLQVRSSVSHMHTAMDLAATLDESTEITPEQYNDIMDLRESRYGKSDVVPTTPLDLVAPGATYLESIDAQYRRTYSTN